MAESWNLGTRLEVADAEVFAIAKALALALQNTTPLTRSTYIFVDSQAAIARLQNRKGVRTIQHALTTAEYLQTRGVTVYIQWCPSHMGIAGNELADTLAKQGVENRQDKQQTPHQKHLPRHNISLGHLHRLAKKDVVKRWQELWYTWEKKEEEGRQVVGLGRTYRLTSRDSLTFSLRPRPTIINLPKPILSAFIQLKTGKGLLKSFQFAIQKADDDKCFCNGAKRQDTRHLLLECKEFDRERKNMKKDLKGIPLGLNVLFCTPTGHKALVGFLEETKICRVGWQYAREE